MLQLIYLGNGEVLRYSPDEQDLLATERKVEAIWAAIALARETRDWRPNRSPMCGYCSHQAICPAWGGTPPPLPPEPPAELEEAGDGLTDEDLD
jgi:putative RecB family exonuclease